MQAFFSQSPALIESPETVPEGVLTMGLLALVFLGLGIWLARLLFGRSASRLKTVLNENFQWIEKTGMIAEDQNLLLAKLAKSASIYKADLNFRDTKIKKLESDLGRVQGEFNAKIKSESQLTGDLRNRERELERLKKELSHLQDDFGRREQDFTSAMSERGEDLERLRNESHSHLTRLEQLNGEFEEKSNAFAALEQNFAATGGMKEKISSLEDLLTNRDNELSRLRGDRDQMRSDLENTLRNREIKIMELEDSLGESESVIQVLQSDLTESQALNGKIKEFENLLAGRDLEIEELKKNQVAKGELQNEIEQLNGEKNLFQEEVARLEDQLRQRDSEIQNIKKQYHESKQARDAKFQEITTRLEEQNAELKSLRALQSTTDKLKARVPELEWILGERDSELNQLRSEKVEIEASLKEKDGLNSKIEELNHLLGIQEGEIASIRKERLSIDKIQSRIEELELHVGEREREVEKLQAERAELRRQLSMKNKNHGERDLKLLRVEKVSEEEEGLQARIRELERIISERNGDLRPGKAVVRVERKPHDDLYARIRDLERLVTERDREPKAHRSHDESEYRFTLADGSVTYLKGDQTIEYEGETHRADDLYYILKDRGTS